MAPEIVVAKIARCRSIDLSNHMPYYGILGAGVLVKAVEIICKLG